MGSKGKAFGKMHIRWNGLGYCTSS